MYQFTLVLYFSCPPLPSPPYYLHSSTLLAGIATLGSTHLPHPHLLPKTSKLPSFPPHFQHAILPGPGPAPAPAPAPPPEEAIAASAWARSGCPEGSPSADTKRELHSHVREQRRMV